MARQFFFSNQPQRKPPEAHMTQTTYPRRTYYRITTESGSTITLNGVVDDAEAIRIARSYGPQPRVVRYETERIDC